MNKSAFILPLSGTISDVKAQIHGAKNYIALFECRLDLIQFQDLKEVSALLKSCKKPYMLTLKPETEQQLHAQWQWANSLEPSYIDIDVCHIEKLKMLPKTKAELIISSHTHEEGQSPMNALKQLRAKAPKSAIIKIATNRYSALDLFDLLKFLQKDNQDQLRSIFLFTGVSGRFMRLMAPLYANQLSFVAFDEKSKTDPGQLTAHELETLYRPMLDLKQVPFFALLGRPTIQSKGPIFHNKRFLALGTKAIYTTIDLSDNDFLPFIKKVQASPFFKGFSITMPFKSRLIANPINTLVFEKDQWRMFNTDGLAAASLLKERGIKRGMQVAILGTGGTAVAIAQALNKEGIEVAFISRTKTGNYKGNNVYSYSALKQIHYDALIQATPAGFNGEKFSTALKKEQFKKGAVYFECVQKTNTPFLEKAVEVSNTIIHGHELFQRQADLQSKRFTNAVLNVSTKALSSAFSS